MKWVLSKNNYPALTRKVVKLIVVDSSIAPSGYHFAFIGKFVGHGKNLMSFPEVGMCQTPENWNFINISGWVFQDLSIRVNRNPAQSDFQHTKEIKETDGGDFNDVEEVEDDEEFHPEVVEFNRAFKEVNFFLTTVVKCCW